MAELDVNSDHVFHGSRNDSDSISSEIPYIGKPTLSISKVSKSPSSTSTPNSNSFKLPENYQKINIPNDVLVDYSDIGDDNELWLIRVPPGIDIRSLEKTKICLNEKTAINQNEEMKLICSPSVPSEIQTLTVLFPDSEHNRIASVRKHLTGKINIFEELNLPEPVTVNANLKHHTDAPRDLRQRYFPFGSVVGSRKSFTNSKVVKSEIPSSSDTSEKIPETPRKTKKKRRRTSEDVKWKNENLYFEKLVNSKQEKNEISEELNLDFRISPISSEQMNIKTETPSFLDEDEYVSQINQNVSTKSSPKKKRKSKEKKERSRD